MSPGLRLSLEVERPGYPGTSDITPNNQTDPTPVDMNQNNKFNN